MTLRFPVITSYGAEAQVIIWEFDSNDPGAPAKPKLIPYTSHYEVVKEFCETQELGFSRNGSVTEAFAYKGFHGYPAVYKDWAIEVSSNYYIFSHTSEPDGDKAFTLSVAAYKVTPIQMPWETRLLFPTGFADLPQYMPSLRLCSEWLLKIDCSGNGPLFQISVNGQGLRALSDKDAKKYKEYIGGITRDMLPGAFRKVYDTYKSMFPRRSIHTILKEIYKKPALLDMADDVTLLRKGIRMSPEEVSQDKDSVFGIPRSIVGKLKKQRWDLYQDIRKLLETASAKEVEELLDDMVQCEDIRGFVVETFVKIFLFPSSPWKVSDHKALLNALVSGTPPTTSVLYNMLCQLETICSQIGRTWDFELRPPQTISGNAVGWAYNILSDKADKKLIGDILTQRTNITKDGYILRNPKNKEELAWDMATIGYTNIYNADLQVILVRKEDNENEPLATLLYTPSIDFVDIQGDRDAGRSAAKIFRESLNT